MQHIFFGVLVQTASEQRVNAAGDASIERALEFAYSSGPAIRE